MPPIDKELSCDRYSVCTCAVGPDRDALLATPIGVALLAALAEARTAAAAMAEAEQAQSKAYEASCSHRSRSMRTAEGAALSAAHDAVEAARQVSLAADEALEAARAAVELDRLLGREVDRGCVEAAQEALRAAQDVYHEAIMNQRSAEQALEQTWDTGIEKTYLDALEASSAAYWATESAESKLRVAIQPFGIVLTVEAYHW
jgi:hypothetical protein